MKEKSFDQNLRAIEFVQRWASFSKGLSGTLQLRQNGPEDPPLNGGYPPSQSRTRNPRSQLKEILAEKTEKYVGPEDMECTGLC